MKPSQNGTHGLNNNTQHLELKRKKHLYLFGKKHGMDNVALAFFDEIPDDVLVELTLYHREELNKMCNALSLDLYFIEYEYTSNR
jgi:hypothetical protein